MTSLSREQQKPEHAQWSSDEIEHYFAAVREVSDLRIFVLVRHVALEEWLRTILARRLEADTLPQMPFAVLMGVALAGSKFTAARGSTGLFNEARNHVAHPTVKKNYEKLLAEFIASVEGTAWPEDEQQRITAVSSALGTLMVQIESLLP